MFKQTYRKRFGIETSYRQLREALGMTTRRSETYRLLRVGIALLIRNLWVWCQSNLGILSLNWLLDELRIAFLETLVPTSQNSPKTLENTGVLAVG